MIFAIVTTLIYILLFLFSNEPAMVQTLISEDFYINLLENYEILLDFLVGLVLPIVIIFSYLKYIYKNTGKYRQIDRIKINKKYLRYIEYLKRQSKEKGSKCSDKELISRIVNQYFEKRSFELERCLKQDDLNTSNEFIVPFRDER